MNSYHPKIFILKKKEYSYFGEALVMNYDILHSNKLIFGKVMGLIEPSTVFKLFQKVKNSNFCDLWPLATAIEKQFEEIFVIMSFDKYFWVILRHNLFKFIDYSQSYGLKTTITCLKNAQYSCRCWCFLATLGFW